MPIGKTRDQAPAGVLGLLWIPSGSADHADALRSTQPVYLNKRIRAPSEAVRSMPARPG
jgi:hypothetical protein